MVFHDSCEHNDQIFQLCEQHGIVTLGADAIRTIQAQLYGPLIEALIPMWE